MDLVLYNSVSKAKEIFQPANSSKVGLYVCGPTVYSAPHIGNARSTVVYDVLYRVLCHKYGAEQVNYVRNITDVDDKINAAAQARGVTIQAVTAAAYAKFQRDMQYFNCLSPNVEPKVTTHMQIILTMIERLLERGAAYVAANGDVYFRITAAPNYGALAGRKLDELLVDVRIENSQYKEQSGDFVLWKAVKATDDQSAVFASPWGPGRPGWHIECSAMSTHYLGQDFDIHGGGIDLIFPHHTNEIAQSVCCYPGSNFAKYWVHNGFITVAGQKMSKSLGNFLTVDDLLREQILGPVARFAFLLTHYRKPMDWNQKMLQDAHKSLRSFYQNIAELLTSEPVALAPEVQKLLYNDLNIPAVLAQMHRLNGSKGGQAQLYAIGRILGLFTEEVNPFIQQKLDNGAIEILVEQRQKAKLAKDYIKADALRAQLQELGVEVQDLPDGTSQWSSSL